MNINHDRLGRFASKSGGSSESQKAKARLRAIKKGSTVKDVYGNTHTVLRKMGTSLVTDRTMTDLTGTISAARISKILKR